MGVIRGARISTANRTKWYGERAAHLSDEVEHHNREPQEDYI